MNFAPTFAIDTLRPTAIPSAATPRPLVVDLDGTLLRTDSLHETLAVIAFSRPNHLPAIFAALRHGRAAFKRAAAAAADLDCATLPYNDAVLDMIVARRAAGGEVHLVTAADQSIADRTMAYLECFTTATGSDGRANLKGKAKADALAARFPDGFDYIGDSAADIPVWQQAGAAIVVGGSSRLDGRLAKAGLGSQSVPVRRASLKGWVKMLRLHQWSKNSLLFVPAVLSHEISDLYKLAVVLLAFLLFGIVASATYIINDLSDLRADRLHPTKRRRALAAGLVPIRIAALLVVMMLGTGLLGAFLLNPMLGIATSCYVALTLAYSFALKRQPLIDTTVIAGLFALRIIAGMALIDRPLSLWLIAFTMTLFLSLSLAKRTSELVQAARSGRIVHGRGYVLGDEGLTETVGVGAGLLSAIVMVMYFSIDAAPAGLYASQAPLFLIPIVLNLWIMRIWLLAHRGTLNDDPVLFAIRDRGSWLHACAVAGCWAVAVGGR